MSKRRTEGWAGLVDIDDEPAPENTTVEADATFDDVTPIDGVASPSPPARAAPKALPPKPVLPNPASKSALRLPVPVGPPVAAPPPRPMTELDLAAPARSSSRNKPAAFSGDDFADKIAGPLGAKTASAPSGWREYRELIATGVIGALLLGGAITWRVMNPPEELEGSAPAGPLRAGQRRGLGQQQPSTPPSPVPSTTSNAAPNDVAESAPPVPQSAPGTQPTPSPSASAKADIKPIRAATPMLTVITVPSEADVEINDQFVGRSPLITTAPAGTKVLSLRVSKDGHQVYEQKLAPNEGGHFSASVKLLPKR